MPLNIGYDASGLDGKLRMVLDALIASLQTWVGGQEGINAAQRLDELSSGLGRLASVPTGMIAPWPTASAPMGYLLCDGAPVSRTQYATLYNLIGTTYGAGDNATTFNVPDLRGRFPLGKAASGTGSTLAGTGGAIDHVHTGPSHTHTVSGTTASESSHTHTIAVDVGGVVTSRTETVDQNLDGATQPGVLIENGVDTHTHGEENESTSAGSAHSHGAGTLAAAAGGTGDTGSANPPFIALNYVIKT